MKVHNRIEIEFAGVTLPIVQDREGTDVVALKPISDSIGLEWQRQYKRTQAAYMARRLGVCVVQMYYAGQLREMVCIRVDRVIAFLNSLNPDQVRSAGNHKAADFLEEKHREWDGVLHEYESRKGGMLQVATVEARTKAVNVRLFVSVMRAKQATEITEDRRALSEVAAGLAGDLGISYQLELTD